MLSIRVSSLPIHGQIFDHVEVSHQYDVIFGCEITFQFVKADFLRWEVCWEHIYLLFEICFFVCFHSNGYYTACLVEVFKFHFKVFGFLLLRYDTPLLVLLIEEKKRDISSLFSKE